MKRHWLLGLITSGLLLFTTSGTVLATNQSNPAATPVTQTAFAIDDSRVRPTPLTKQARLMKVDLTGAAVLTACGGVGLGCWYRTRRYHRNQS